MDLHGIEAVETREITVNRTYADFEEFWTISQFSAAIGPLVAKMSAEDVESLRSQGKGAPAGGCFRAHYL